MQGYLYSKADIGLKGTESRTLAYLTIENLDTKKKKEPEREQSSPSFGQEFFFSSGFSLVPEYSPRSTCYSIHTHFVSSVSPGDG